MILHGNCLTLMPTLAAESVQTCVTSPPYFGLRSYLRDDDPLKVQEIGSEATPDCLGWATGNACGVCFVCVQVRVFREVRRVLRKDGTCWVNLGDSYAGSRGGGAPSESSTLAGNGHTGGGPKLHALTASRRRDNHEVPRSDVRRAGFKEKDLMGMPWRVALALQADGWRLRQDIIWHKPNPMPESTRDRCTKAHEYLFLFSKSRRYYYDHAAIKEPVTGGANARGPGNRQHVKYSGALDEDRDGEHRTKGGLIGYAERQREKRKPPSGWDMGEGGHRELAGRYDNNGVGFGHGYDKEPKPRVAGVTPKSLAKTAGSRLNASFQAATSTDVVDERNKRSVWTIPTQPYAEAHFATFPEALVEPCILAGSKPGDLVLDPFLGAATVGVVATRLGREFVGIELNADSIAIAERRLAGTTRGLAL